MSSLPPGDSITAKGTLIKTSLAFVEERFGAAAINRVLAALEPDVRGKVSGMILSSGRYPVTVVAALQETIDRVLGKGDLALAWEIGKFAGEYEVTMFHKAVFQIGKLEYFLKAAPMTWGFYYSAGKMKVEEIAATGGRVVVRDFNPVSKAVCYRTGGWMWRTAELCHKRNVSIKHPECVLDGRPACLWVASWT